MNYNVDELIKIFDEAKLRKYPDHVLKYDLNNYLSTVEKESYDDGYNAGYDYAKYQLYGSKEV